MPTERPPTQFLRVEGVLWENMVFERTLGWETATAVFPRDAGDGTYACELLDEHLRALVSVPAVVHFREREIGLADQEPVMSGRRLAYAIVHAYVPLHAQGRELIFRRGDQILYRSEVTPEPPRLAIRENEPAGDDAWRVSWDAEHSLPLTFDVSYVYGPGGVLTLARGLEGRDFVADLSQCPGSREALLAVLATDGTRSTFAVTEPFRVRDKRPVVWIQAPTSEHPLPPDQPVSLAGHAVDLGGTSLPDESLVWRVDGEVVHRGAPVAMATGLEPGLHMVELAHEGSGAEARMEITIAERNPETPRASEMIARARGAGP